MLKKLLYTFIICTVFMTACGHESHDQAEMKSYYSFEDSVGNTVILEDKPQKVAVLFSSYAELWLLAGGEIYATVGDSVDRGFCGEEAVLLDDGAGRTVNTELLLASAPDLVIGTADFEGQLEACALAAEAGIPAALFRVESVEDYLNMLKICSDITGNPDAYEEYGIKVADEIENIKAEACGEQKKILFIRAGSQASSTKAKRAEDHFAAAILEELGAYNIADNAKLLLDGLSLEEVIEQDPDEIFITVQGDEEAGRAYMEKVFASQGWADLRAVQEQKCYFLPKDLFNYKPNARYAESYRYLARLLYPEIDL